VLRFSTIRRLRRIHELHELRGFARINK